MSLSTHLHHGGQTGPQDNDFGPSLTRSPTSKSRREPHPSDPEYNLDEVAAPLPVYDRSEGPIRPQEYLEGRRESGNIRDQQLRHESGDTESDQISVSDEEKSLTRRHILEFSRNVCIVSHLIVFSLVGTLLRLAIESLTFYPGTPVTTSVLWANVGGCIIMGFLSEDQELFRLEDLESRIPEEDAQDDARRTAHLTTHKKTMPLYIGLTTGFCGGVTSFSTFMRDAFLTLVNYLPVPIGTYPEISPSTPALAQRSAPNGGFRFMALLAVFFTEIGLSIVGLFLGVHLAIFLSRWTPSIPQRWLRTAIDPTMVPLACLSWVAVICLVVLLPEFSKHMTLWSSQTWRGPVLFSLVFAPLGCLARFYLSIKLNSRIPSFPLGTFVVNMSGTMVLGMAYSLQHAPIGSSNLGGGSFIGCEVLQGIIDGFCGCLTIVSTWALELCDLRRGHAYIYGFASIAVGLCALIVEIGSLKWTRGFTSRLC